MAPALVKDAEKLAKKIKTISKKTKNVSLFVAPPFFFVPALNKILGRTKIGLGVQHVATSSEEAQTGEVSAVQAKSVGATFAIVGHSEERARGDSKEVVLKRMIEAINAGIAPVLCLGESTRDKDGKYLEYLKNEVEFFTKALTKTDFERSVLAYEPVWAIGKNAERPATTYEAEETIIFLRKTLAHFFDEKLAHKVKILYGGSVNKDNAVDFLRLPSVSGLLIGRLSHDPETLSQIINFYEKSGK